MKKERPENKSRQPQEKSSRPASKKEKHHMSPRCTRYILTGLMILAICGVSVLVFVTIHNRSEFPVMAVGQVISSPAAEESSAAMTEEPTEAPTEAPSTEPEPLLTPEEQARELLKDMTLEEKVWQMMFLSPGQMKDEAGKQLPAGAVYFGPEDLSSRAALSKNLDTLQKNAEIPLLVGTSEEGGSMAPLSALGITDATDPMSVVGEAGDPKKAEEIGKTLGSQMKEAGFHFNLAPLADVVTNFYNPVLEDRRFSEDENVTAGMVTAMVKGLQDSGIASCLKHFPDFGSAAMEGGRYQTYRSLEELQGLELIPFQAGIDAGAEMVLVSNMSALVITGDYTTPCSMDQDLISGTLRKDMKFDGVILSDFQNTDTITRNFSAGDAAVHVVSAGCDAILLPADAQAAVQAVLDAVKDGTLTEKQIDDSVYRILLLKGRYGLLTE